MAVPRSQGDRSDLLAAAELPLGVKAGKNFLSAIQLKKGSDTPWQCVKRRRHNYREACGR